MEAAPASRGDPLPLFREGKYFIPNTMLYSDNFVLSPVLAFFDKLSLSVPPSSLVSDK